MRAAAATRRNFIRGRFERLGDDAIRPPTAVADFVELCTGCGRCADACPEQIIGLDDDRRAVIDFALGACTFCGACSDACSDGALNASAPIAMDWRARVGAECLSMQGIACRACEDVCDTTAIRFRLALGGRAQPIIDTDTCTGCGACAHACPTQAVTFTRQTPISTETKV